jgi:hypothetical protein
MVGTVAACLFPDLSKLEGDASAPDVVAADMGSDVTSDVVTDAGSDAATDGADAGYCASLSGTHSLCEDFDEGLFSAKFAMVHATPGASVASNGTEFKSPPDSLFAIIDAGASGNQQAYMTKAFGAAKSATYAFDFRVDQWSVGHSAVLAAVKIDDGLPTLHQVSLYTTDSVSALEEVIPAADGGFLYLDHPFSKGIALMTWTRLSFTVDFVGRTCSAMMDGQVVVTTPMDASWKAGALSIELAFSYVGAQPQGWSARWDNVVFDYQ